MNLINIKHPEEQVSFREAVLRGLGSDQPNRGQAGFYTTDAKSFQAQPTLHDEIFGATGLVVRCANAEELRTLAESLEGQLTATLHLDAGDTAIARSLLPILERKAGRILANGWPTGVEVCQAMVHGGPWPATTDSRATSVGTAAIERFLRPVCYQDLPAELLPEALQDAEKAVAADPNYCKGHFRMGLALHALKRHHEAARALTKALDLEPKNVQIKQALGFAELKARKAMMSA